MERRVFISSLAAVGIGYAWPTNAQQASSSDVSVDEWMTAWMDRRALQGTLNISRFVEPVYFLLKPISWKPNSTVDKYPAVIAPTGFVTDFASIPRVFWSLLKPDGEYAYAAVIHDFLYWTQSTTREVADGILKRAMEDLEVYPKVVSGIFHAVRTFGGSAWDQNAKLKAQGERRILKKFPDSPTTRWKDWKSRPDVFA